MTDYIHFTLANLKCIAQFEGNTLTSLMATNPYGKSRAYVTLPSNGEMELLWGTIELWYRSNINIDLSNFISRMHTL